MLFGNVGKWSSLNGSTKSYRNDLITINWCVHKKALVFQNQLGDILKNKLINLSVNNVLETGQYNQLYDLEAHKNCPACSRLSSDMMELKSDVKQMSTLIKKFYHESSLSRRYSIEHLNSANTCEIGIQTDTELSHYFKQSGECCSGRCNELSAEIEGLKLDLVISESKIENKIRANSNAIDQVQAGFANIQNQIGEVVQLVDRLVSANKITNANYNNISKSVVGPVKENKGLINSIDALYKGLSTCMTALCNANLTNQPDHKCKLFVSFNT